MKFDHTDDLLTLVDSVPKPERKVPVTGHEGLKEYERGTRKFLNEVGHWHADGERRTWIRGPVAECPNIRRARTR